MNWTKIALAICAFLLAICLTFAITALTSLRNAVAETGRIKEEAEALLDELEIALRTEPEEKTDSGSNTDGAQQVGVLYDQFCVRESGGRVAVYTGSGELVRLTDIWVSALPAADRKALAEGIRFSSWKEVLALMQDLTP